MQTGMHQWLLNNSFGQISFDIAFYSMPLLYLVIYKYKSKLSAAAAGVMLLVNFCYVQCYTLYPSNSIEGHIAWLLFPIVFIPQHKRTFMLLLEGLRYFFLFYFSSAGIWKLAQGGAFSVSQMSGVLLYQHNQLLTSSPGYWQSEFILFLIQRQQLSYLLYLSATLLELSFIIGFFTKKYDRLLVFAFLLFILLDILIMRMPYFEVFPLLLTLWFSKAKKMQVNLLH